jgi:outer membrane protein TolC
LQTTTILQADTTGLFAAISLLSETNYEQLALSNRTELKAADCREQASQSNVKVAQSVFYPTVGVGADYAYDRPNQRIFPPSDEFNGTWDVGIKMSWNLTNLYAGRHNVQDAKMQATQASLQSDMLTDNIRMEVFQNYSACQTAQNKLNTLTLAVKQSEENARQMKVKYDQQAALMSDVLDANAALLQAQINLVMQRAELQLASRKLLKSSGTLQ